MRFFRFRRSTSNKRLIIASTLIVKYDLRLFSNILEGLTSFSPTEASVDVHVQARVACKPIMMI